MAASQGRQSVVAAIDVVDPRFDPLTAPDGAVLSMGALRGPDPAASRAEVGTCLAARGRRHSAFHRAEQIFNFRLAKYVAAHINARLMTNDE